MAGSSFFALLDDIATLLDDVAVLSKIATKNASAALDDVATLTKVATQKTAGVLGDDLALNAEQVAGVLAERELPVVLAVAKGSAINKVILVPTALAISAVVPWAVTPQPFSTPSPVSPARMMSKSTRSTDSSMNVMSQCAGVYAAITGSDSFGNHSARRSPSVNR